MTEITKNVHETVVTVPENERVLVLKNGRFATFSARDATRCRHGLATGDLHVLPDAAGIRQRL